MKASPRAWARTAVGALLAGALLWGLPGSEAQAHRPGRDHGFPQYPQAALLQRCDGTARVVFTVRRFDPATREWPGATGSQPVSLWGRGGSAAMRDWSQLADARTSAFGAGEVDVPRSGPTPSELQLRLGDDTRSPTLSMGDGPACGGTP